jgi:hypothetical protein
MQNFEWKVAGGKNTFPVQNNKAMIQANIILKEVYMFRSFYLG